METKDLRRAPCLCMALHMKERVARCLCDYGPHLVELYFNEGRISFVTSLSPNIGPERRRNFCVEMSVPFALIRECTRSWALWHVDGT
jgi:hypothetical protein